MFSVLIWPSVPLLISLVAIQSGLTALFEPAKNAIFPDILSDRELVAANALGAAMWSTMLTVGSALGGWFTDVFGWQAALLVDASSYVVSAMLIWTLREPNANRAAATSMWINLKEGASHMLAHRDILTLALVKMMWSVAGAVTILLALLGENRFSLSESGLISVGLFYMARGLGTGLGPFLARWLSNEDPRRMEKLIGWGFVCGGGFYVLMPWVSTIALAMLLVTLAHLGGATVWVFSTVRLQQQLASEIRGRVFAVEHALFLLMSVISTAVYSWLSDSVGISAQNLLGATGLSLLLMAAIGGLCSPKPAGISTSQRSTPPACE